MPHIIVEYSKNIEEKVDVAPLLGGMHAALADAGVDEGRIKSRAVAMNHSVVGNHGVNAGQMVHITLLLLAGRDNATKAQYSQPLHALAKQSVTKEFPNCAVTLEVRDMDAENYIL